MKDCRPGQGRDVVAVPPGTRVPAGSQEEEWSGSWTDINSNESRLGGRMRWRCFKTWWRELNYTSWSPSVQPFGSIQWLMPLIFTRSVILTNTLQDVEYLKQFETIWWNPLCTHGRARISLWAVGKRSAGAPREARQRSRPIKTWVKKNPLWFSSCSVTCSVAADLKVPRSCITSLMWWLYIFKDTAGATY